MDQELRVCSFDKCVSGNPGSKLCSRCATAAYCSTECQRADWKCHKLVCQEVATPENEIATLLKQGRLYSAQRKVAELSKPNARLTAEVENLIGAGIHSEVIENRLVLKEISGAGYPTTLGYVASRNLEAGEPLLFDTSFSTVSIMGKDEFHFRLAERAIRKGNSSKRRTDPIADAQGDFFHNRILSLSTKGKMDPAFLKGTVDEDTRIGMIICSVAEANCLQCNMAPEYIALYVAASRFNHSCAPNASYESNRQTILVRASASIQEGEEVTISYLPAELLAARESRRSRLENGRGFDCMCQRCLSEPTTGEDVQQEPADAHGAEEPYQTLPLVNSAEQSASETLEKALRS